jgi:plastocyanin
LLPSLTWAASHTVTANPDNTFTPANITIQQGDSITWSNNGGLHNVRATDASFRCANGCDGTGGDGTPSAATWSFSLTFNTPGTINYDCEVHVALGMVGQIVVQGGVANPGSLRFSSAAFEVSEGAGSRTITVRREGGSDGAVSVQYATSNGSASAGSDYTATSGTLNWADGDSTNKTFDVPILEDGAVEGAETLDIALSNPAGGADLGTPSDTVLTINDNDVAQPGALSFTSSTITTDEGAGSATISAQRTGGTNGPVSVQYATAGGTATAGSDYTATAGTLNWGNGEAGTKSFDVPILEDNQSEGTETVGLSLSSPGGGAGLGMPINATLSITDNDAQPMGEASFAADDFLVNEGDGPAEVRVERTGSDALSFDYQVVADPAASNPADPGADFTAANGTLTWATGDTSDRTIAIPIADDSDPEGNETFAVTGIGAGAPAATVLIADDDWLSQEVPEVCNLDVVPAATLLFPYFEVDMNNVAGITTLISINNASAESQVAQVTLWTDFSVPSLTFSLFLTGYDVQTINMRDILQGGLIPSSGATLSNQGQVSAPNVDLLGCGDPLPNPVLDSTFTAHLQAWHSGQASPSAGTCAGSPQDGLMVGYVTVDVVNSCSSLNPSDSGYFVDGGLGIASNDNALFGDLFFVTSAEDFAQGEPAVHLVANPEAFGSGAYTFYGRYVGGDGSDDRQPLGSAYAFRYLNGGVFTGGTELIVWRDSKSVDSGEVTCGTLPSWAPLPSATILAFDEEENVLGLPENNPFPWETQRVRVGSTALPVAADFGWLQVDLNHSATPLFGDRAQGYVLGVMNALGRFSVGFRATRLSGVCEPE